VIPEDPEAPAGKRAGRARWLGVYSGRGLSPNVRALSLTSLLQDVASEMVYPLLPAFLVSLGGGAAALGVMESAAEGMQALVKGWAGRASDRAGRRKPFVGWGYGLSALARPLMAAAALPVHLVLLRVADRFAKGLRTAPRDALIAESTPPEHRGFAFSFHRGLDHLGAAVGPLLATGLLLAAPGRVRLVLALATIPALVGWAVVVLRVREPRAAGDGADAGEPAGAPGGAGLTVPTAPTVPTRLLAPPPALRLPLAAFVVFSLGNAADAFLLLRASEVGLSVTGVTLLWSGFHVVKWLASAPSGRLADRLGPRRPLLAGWVLYALVYLGFAVADSVPALVALFAVYALYYGLTEGAEKALVVRLAGDGAATGTSLGSYHLVSGLGLFAASLVFGLVWEVVTPAAAFGMGAALAALATALLAAVRVPPAGATR
jgi:MFS family permease